MGDLVINHCAADSELISTHPDWFAWERNSIVHPGADENGRRVVWKDLAIFDHRNTKDPEGLLRYFLDIVDYMISLGFRGFRCDATYQVSRILWKGLISEVRKKHGGILFFAETLGSPSDITRNTASAGFDYIFNSSKW